MAGPITGTPKKEVCFFCGAESVNGSYVKVANKKGLLFGRWACKDCLDEYRELTKNGKC